MFAKLPANIKKLAKDEINKILGMAPEEIQKLAPGMSIEKINQIKQTGKWGLRALKYPRIAAFVGKKLLKRALKQNFKSVKKINTTTTDSGV